MSLFGRRSFPLAIAHGVAALTVVSTWGATCVTKTTSGESTPAREATPERQLAETVSTPGSVEAAASTAERPQGSQRATPLPVPLQDERAWLQEWLDLITLTSRTATTGC